MNTLTDNCIYIDAPAEADASVPALEPSSPTDSPESQTLPEGLTSGEAAEVPADSSSLSVSQPSFTQQEAEKMAREAFLRGRNEAISAALTPGNHTPGVADPATPPSDPALADIFNLRPSVWS